MVATENLRVKHPGIYIPDCEVDTVSCRDVADVFGIGYVRGNRETAHLLLIFVFGR